MKKQTLVLLIVFFFTGFLNADENNYEKPFMEEGYYRVLESTLQIPSLQFKEIFNEFCYVKYWENQSGDHGYNINPIEGVGRFINFYTDGSRIYYRGFYYINNQVTSHSRFEFEAEFDSKKGDTLLFLQKNQFNGDVTRRVVLTYLGKDLKQAVKKLK